MMTMTSKCNLNAATIIMLRFGLLLASPIQNTFGLSVTNRFFSRPMKSTSLFSSAKSSTGSYAASSAYETIRSTNTIATYTNHWEHLLLEEHREHVQELKHRRKTWSKSRLEASGTSIFFLSAEPDSEMFGEKIIRLYKEGEKRFREKFNRGDVLLVTPEVGLMGKDPVPREGMVMDVGKDWMTLGVGSSWPVGLWEMRKHAGRYLVRLDRTAPQAPLRAQRKALEALKQGKAGDAAVSLAKFFDGSTFVSNGETNDYVDMAAESARRAPSHFDVSDLEERISNGFEEAIMSSSFEPNKSQKEAVFWALGRKLALIRGPPGTGKTRVAALLISTAMRTKVQKDGMEQSPRILAVTHSNGAADVLLKALLEMNVPAVRAGRPASVSPSVQHRTITALSEKMPELKRLRQQARDVSLDNQTRQSAAYDVKQYANELHDMIVSSAPVIVASCVGAQQLLLGVGSDGVRDGEPLFPIVVLDEAAQTTEPALLCALAAARAEQVIMVGDTRQLPPTITSQNPELRATIGVSPMERLLKIGVEEFLLNEQYRMPEALLYHPNRYFYDGLVQCAVDKNEDLNQSPPKGFPWPNRDEPLAFLGVGKESEIVHNFGGRSNPGEVELIMGILHKLIDAGDIQAENIAIITPYSKQVQLFRTELNNASLFRGSKLSEVVVGTVDAFQGQEKDLIIFSAVRSNAMKELGFLRDSRRLNVAITRAKRGLIVVGDSSVLKSCRHWAALLDCCSNRGCTLTEEEYLLCLNDVEVI